MENGPGNGLNLIFKSLNKWKTLLLSTVPWGDQSPGLDFLLTQMGEASLLLWFLAALLKAGLFSVLLGLCESLDRWCCRGKLDLNLQ